AVADLAAGRMNRADFLQRFGHRGPQEMELSKPRWAEDHRALDQLVNQGSIAAGFGGSVGPGGRESTSFKQRVAAEVRQIIRQDSTLEHEVAQLHTYL